jgi:ribA/ribD-fused uncharacterized protein
MKITDKYVFFWGGVFSQWQPSVFIIDNVTYSSAEQYMMHQKALLFGDTETAEEIMKTDSPKNQKELGRGVKNFSESIWKRNCFSIVYRANLAKFTQNEDFKKFLMESGNRTFVEASPDDVIWGIGLFENAEGIEDVAKWQGTNLLGFAITMVRDTLIKG